MIVEEQAQRALRTAFSPLVRESKALTCALFDDLGQLVALSETSSPFLLGRLLHEVQEEALPQLRSLAEGEYLVRSATGPLPAHSDLVVIQPLLQEARPLAYIAAAAHVPLVASACHVVRKEALAGLESRRDVAALMAGNDLASQRLRALLAESDMSMTSLASYITSESRHAMLRHVRAAEMLANFKQTACIKLEDLQAYEVELSVELHAGEDFLDVKLHAELDAKSKIQGSPGFISTSVAKFACMLALGEGIPVTSGSLGVFRISFPTASLLDATPNGHAMHVAGLLPNLLLHCLSSDHAASAPCLAITWDGGLHLEAGGLGAQVDQDGWSSTHFFGLHSTPLEVTEASTPCLFLCRELVPDSGQPGRHRGGLGVRCLLRQRLRDLQLETEGGRGLGAPGQRARELVARDLREGYITAKGAEAYAAGAKWSASRAIEWQVGSSARAAARSERCKRTAAPSST